MLIIIFIILILLLVLISNYQTNVKTFCKSMKKLEGRTAIVTGGTSGIGLEIALDFARRGARVIIACPYKDEGITAQNFISKSSGNYEVFFKLLDLSSLKSIRKFSKEVIKNENRLDILVNNAGVGITGDFLTKDGMHFIMQVNYYGHFLLTLLLLPLLIKSGSKFETSRIVNMTSNTRFLASLELNNYDTVGYWTKFRIYANSKFCLVLFSRELTKRIKNSEKIRYVVVNNADPGVVATRIFDSFNYIFGRISRKYMKILFKNPGEGAQTAIYIALDEKAGLVSGQVYKNCKLVDNKLSNNFNTVTSNLWERSIRLVRLENHELENIDI